MRLRLVASLVVALLLTACGTSSDPARDLDVGVAIHEDATATATREPTATRTPRATATSAPPTATAVPPTSPPAPPTPEPPTATARPAAVSVPISGGVCPQGYPVKANPDSMIYHVPGGGSYSRTRNARVQCFDTPANAQAAGYRAARN